MINLLRRWWRPPTPIEQALWRDVRASLPWVAALDATRDQRLQQLTARFLHSKTVTPVAGLTLDPLQRAMLAALCCLPLLKFGEQGLHGWSQLIVYPGAFRVERSHIDAAGVLHQWNDELIGEAWDAGPVVLSWADVMADCADPHAGRCVAAHEIAHKLDALDGVLDGTPPLPRAWQHEWARDFQTAYDALVETIETGGRTAVDPYAAEAPEEFFAVVTEYHFSAPDTLRGAMPEIAVHLARLYGTPPFANG